MVVSNQKYSIVVFWGTFIFTSVSISAFVWFYGVNRWYTWKTWLILHCKPLIFFKVIKWIHPIFAAFYLGKVDQSSTLVNEVSAIAQSTVKSITVSKTTSVDEFIKNLSIDQNGNVQVVLINDCQSVTLNT